MSHFLGKNQLFSETVLWETMKLMFEEIQTVSYAVLWKYTYTTDLFYFKKGDERGERAAYSSTWEGYWYIVKLIYTNSSKYIN